MLDETMSGGDGDEATAQVGVLPSEVAVSTPDSRRKPRSDWL